MSATALIRRPGPRLADGIITHIAREPVDAERAVEQWNAYGDVLRAAGWRTAEVPPADDNPDSVFVEDTMVVHGHTAVITRPGAPSRRAETAAAQATVADFGYDIEHIAAPATLDGGDVLKVGEVMYVGRSGRTNTDGIRQLADAFAPRGVRVIEVPVTRVLHLKTAVTALPDGTVIGWPPAVDDPSLFARFTPMPEAGGASVVLLGGRQVLMSAAAPRSAEVIDRLGYVPVSVDISEFEKLEGSVTCLSVRLRHADAVSRAWA